jgi:hypothetical protein
MLTGYNLNIEQGINIYFVNGEAMSSFEKIDAAITASFCSDFLLNDTHLYYAGNSSILQACLL